MILINKKAVEDARKELEKAAESKFVANELTSMCLCRCSDG